MLIHHSDCGLQQVTDAVASIGTSGPTPEL